jgi:hypothetical protein
MYGEHETTAQLLTRLACIDGRTLRGAALSYGLPVSAFHAWATGRALPSPLAIPGLARATGIPEAELAEHVAAERAAEVRPPPTSARRALGDPAAVSADVRDAVAADAGLVREYVGALADGKLDLGELVSLRAKAEAIRAASAALVRDLDAAIESSDKAPAA